MAESHLHYKMSCFYCGLFVFIIPVKQHPKQRSSAVHIRRSLHSALKTPLMVKDLMEEDAGKQAGGCGGYGELRHQARCHEDSNLQDAGEILSTY